MEDGLWTRTTVFLFGASIWPVGQTNRKAVLVRF